MLHSYVRGADGRLDHTFTPLIDGTLGGADALCDMLRLLARAVTGDRMELYRRSEKAGR